MSIKSTVEEKVIDQEIKEFVKFIRQDQSIKEVNYDYCKVSYIVNGFNVEITFKAKKR